MLGGDVNTDHRDILGSDVDGILFYLGTEMGGWPVGDLMPGPV